jgi:hypothetical protein
MRNAYKILSPSLKRKDQLEALGGDNIRMDFW